MESITPPNPKPSANRTADAAEDLALLNRAKSSVDVDQILDFGPWWYAPLLATTVGGLALFGQQFGSAWSLFAEAAGAVGVGAGAFVALHDHRRRSVRTRHSMRRALFFAPILTATWLITAAWGAAISTLGYERFVPGYAALSWLLTTMVMLGIRSTLQAVRRRRTALS